MSLKLSQFSIVLIILAFLSLKSSQFRFMEVKREAIVIVLAGVSFQECAGNQDLQNVLCYLRNFPRE